MNVEYNTTSETPLTVGLGLYAHQKTRSKELVDTFNRLGLCVTYDKICDIKERIADAVRIRTLENDGLYIPPCISLNSFFSIKFNSILRNRQC